MIAPMKKVTLLGRAVWQDELLNNLRDLGVVHIQPLDGSMPKAAEGLLSEAREKIGVLERALALMPAIGGKGAATDGMRCARQLLALHEKKVALNNEIQALEVEYEEVLGWGRFRPEELEWLKDKGVVIRFFAARKKDLEELPSGLCVQRIGRRGKAMLLAVISQGPEVNLPLPELQAPLRGMAEIEALLANKRKNLAACTEEFCQLTKYRPFLKRDLQEQKKLAAFAEAKGALAMEQDLTYLTGFCPCSALDTLRAAARQKKWGLVVAEPGEDDRIPTLILYSGWTRPFKPVMDFIGVTPGYREFDSNGPSLFFFTIFFAMLVGDAGYGLLLFLAALFFIYRTRADREPFILLALLSAATLIWGTLTGNWFGSESLAQLPGLRQLTIPALTAAAPKSAAAVIQLCCLLGAVQLSFAHLWRAASRIPKLKALADLGWALVIWAIYLLSLFLILSRPINHLAFWLLAVGTSLIFIFSEQEGRFSFRAIGRALARSPLTMLTGLGSLSDLISYIRLFAVGLATREVALAVNHLALETAGETIFSTLAALAILLSGHGLNILLGAMAVLVHGVRLNLLEFSRHLEINWSGIPYAPFSKEKL